MDRFCSIEPGGQIASGGYFKFHIRSHCGNDLHLVRGFVDALALRLMAGYEGQPYDQPLEIDPSFLNVPNRTKSHYWRLFDNDGKPTADFVTVASETVGLWIEESLEKVLYAHAGEPHNSDPVYDVLSIFDDGDEHRLRVVQVKATKDNFAGNCNTALQKFESLEAGLYDAELSNRLNLIVQLRRVPAGISVEDLKLNRRYRVVLVHGDPLGRTGLMTTFDQKVPGDAIRRSAVFAQVDWPKLWEVLADAVYARLA